MHTWPIMHITVNALSAARPGISVWETAPFFHLWRFQTWVFAAFPTPSSTSFTGNHLWFASTFLTGDWLAASKGMFANCLMQYLSRKRMTCVTGTTDGVCSWQRASARLSSAANYNVQWWHITSWSQKVSDREHVCTETKFAHCCILRGVLFCNGWRCHSVTADRIWVVLLSSNRDCAIHVTMTFLYIGYMLGSCVVNPVTDCGTIIIITYSNPTATIITLV